MQCRPGVALCVALARRYLRVGWRYHVWLGAGTMSPTRQVSCVDCQWGRSAFRRFDTSTISRPANRLRRMTAGGKVQPATTPRGIKNPAVDRVAEGRRKPPSSAKENDASFERCKDAAVEPRKRTTHPHRPPLRRCNLIIPSSILTSDRRGGVVQFPQV